MEAINIYQGTFPDVSNGSKDIDEDWYILLCIDSTGQWVKGQMYKGCTGYVHKFFEAVCTKDEFDALVYELETNFGTSIRYHEYKTMVDALSNGFGCKPIRFIDPASASSSEHDEVDRGEKYRVTIRDRRTGDTIQVDIYDVLEAFKITCSALAHAVKKLLLPGSRGAKDYDTDCDEAINSVEQSKLLQKYRD